MKKYIGLEEMSNENCASVLNVIREYKSVQRKQIADITGLSWGGMTKIVNKLFEHGYIIEEKCNEGLGAGRKPNRIQINQNQNMVIGIDINRVGFRACVMNLCGEVQKEYEEEKFFTNKEELLQEILGFVDNIVEEFREKKILAIGIAMQGILDVEKGISVKFPHVPDWKDVPIKQILKERFGVEVFMEHDPNCMLYSVITEEESANSLLFRLDRSIGMSVSLEGKILRGNGILEVTHCIINPMEGRDIESYISSCFVKGELQKEELKELFMPLTLLIYNMSKVFNAKKVILTGKLINYRKEFEAELLETIYQYCDKDEISVKLVEEGGIAIRGISLIAVQGAIDGLHM